MPAPLTVRVCDGIACELAGETVIVTSRRGAVEMKTRADRDVLEAEVVSSNLAGGANFSMT